MTDFAAAMELRPIGDRRWSAGVTPDWGNGRTTFGGLVAALAARVAVQVVGAERPLRSMDIAFVAPIAPGPVELDAEVLGEGKSVTQLVVSVRSGPVLGCRVHVVAGAGRVSAVRVDAVPAELHEGLPGEQGVDFAYLPGLTPEFFQQMEYRWCSEAFPFSGGGPEAAQIQGWIRHRTAVQGVEATVALLDGWPPVVLPMTSGPTPVSTVRWALHLTPPVEQPEAERPWFWYEAKTVQCADGYATGYASLYQNGRLVAWSEQLIAVFDRPAEPAAASLPVVAQGSV
jgi:acyl-CoA thioesterase